MAREAPFPYVENLYRVLAEQIPFIKENMSEPGADDCSGDSPHKQQAEPPFGSALMSEHAGDDFVADEEAHHKSEAIPSQGEKSQLENYGADVPGYET